MRIPSPVKGLWGFDGTLMFVAALLHEKKRKRLRPKWGFVGSSEILIKIFVCLKPGKNFCYTADVLLMLDLSSKVGGAKWILGKAEPVTFAGEVPVIPSKNLVLEPPIGTQMVFGHALTNNSISSGR